MPECRRCGRVLATAELRRTSRGYVCKPGWLGDHCAEVARERRERERRARRGASLRIEGAE
jgi:hypothetical protein